jgi:pimeloyl-ACP methyl ester carboxylesterase
MDGSSRIPRDAAGYFMLGGGKMERIISGDGTPIAFERYGKGPPLVLVHGTAADHTRWAPVVPLLQDQFTLYAVDRRGRGMSGDSPDYSLDKEFTDIAAFVDSIKGPVSLLGHSYGALCSLEAALRAKNLVKLILYEPPIIVNNNRVYPPNFRSRMQSLLDQGKREELLKIFFREIVRMPESQLEILRTESTWAGRLAAAHTLAREMANEDYVFDASRFQVLKIPVLLLLGGDSPMFLQDATQAVHQALPNSQVAVMPGQQHIAMSQDPPMFARLVRDFLTKDG